MKENKTIAQFLGITKFPFEIKNNEGKRIYFETSTGYWEIQEFDANDKQIRFEDSNGYSNKREYDAKGKEIRFEDSNGNWAKSEFDAKGNRIYYENSDGTIIDKRPKQVEFTLAEIATKLNIPVELLRIKE